jgi:hypothetical protein
MSGTGLFRVRSPLLAESLLMSFPPGTEMFQFPGFASYAYVFSVGSSLLRGLPHSDILGSKPARGSPRLFAACHVLRRLLVPRHPPNALLSFNLSPVPSQTSRRSATPSGQTHTHHRKLERDLQLAHHAQEPFIGFLDPQSPVSITARNDDFKRLKSASQTQKMSVICTGRIPCNIHGHHNRNHCIITHLNTQILNDYASGFYPIHRSDNPSPRTRAGFHQMLAHPVHQHTRPNAPKPIHPDKEQFCSRQ